MIQIFQFLKLNLKMNNLITTIKMTTKKELGQYYTKNYEIILQNLDIPASQNIIEPFAGDGSLLTYIRKYNPLTIETYDIDPKCDAITRDTLLNPPIYKDKFVVTNPPYLARNKSTNKTIFDKYQENDLYKCFIRELINQKPCGGIIIIPVNFWSSIRKNDIKLRKDFVQTFQIKRINIFEEQVFNDTTYSVSSCLFTYETIIDKIDKLSLSSSDDNLSSVVDKLSSEMQIFPSQKILKITFNEENDFTIGGEIYKLPQDNKIKIERVTKLNIKERNTNISIKCIDDTPSNQIKAFYDTTSKRVDNTTNLSSRSYLTLIIKPPLSEIEQKELINKFNNFLTEKREKYNSMFLTNYRNNSRKRISFNLVYEIINYLIQEK